MEDFTGKENKGIKEKNLYILPLDTPRIIIITSIFIGLLIISVLIGMNIKKQDDKSYDVFSQNNETAVLDTLNSENSPDSHDAVDENSMSSSIIESPLGKDAGNDMSNDMSSRDHGKKISSLPSPSPASQIINKNDLYKPENNSLNNNSQPFDQTAGEKKIITENQKDILTHENIEAIIPPPVHKKYVENAFSNKHKISREPKKKKKHKTVEVAAANTYSPPQTKKSYFSIQVASYDKKSSALSEIKKLEEMKYNSFIDTTSVNNKTFYRVKIGPIYSKKIACGLLDEISENKRYIDSFLVEK